MKSEFAGLLDSTEHNPDLDSASYGRWLDAIPVIAGFMPRYENTHHVSHDAWIAELLRDAIDLADPEHKEMLRMHIIHLGIPLPGGGDGTPNVATVTCLFQRAVEMIASMRHRGPLVKASIGKLVHMHPDMFRVAPLPHGWIIQHYDSVTGRLEQVLAVGDCLGDIKEHHADRTWASSHLEAPQALYALLESWRLRHGRARRYLCDLLRAALAQKSHHAPPA